MSDNEKSLLENLIEDASKAPKPIALEGESFKEMLKRVYPHLYLVTDLDFYDPNIQPLMTEESGDK